MPNLLKRILFVYRLALVVSKEDGPVKMFPRFRSWVTGQEKRTCPTGEPNRYVLIVSFGDLLDCPFCLGVWFALVSLVAPKWVVNWFAIAGGQHLTYSLFVLLKNSAKAQKTK